MLNLKSKRNISKPNFSSSICCPPSPNLEEKESISKTYQRTISFPVQKTLVTKRTSYKNRSSSLPVRFHPIVSNLDDGVASLKTWLSNQSSSATWLFDGLGLILIVLSTLSDLLNHPLALDPLRKSLATDGVSDDLMRLADMYESFRTCLLNILHLQASTQSALRRRDASRISSAVRAQRKATRGIMQLADVVQSNVKTRPLLYFSNPSVSPDKLGVAMLPTSICNTAIVLASASETVFRGLAKLSDDSTVSIYYTIVAIADHEICNGNVRIWWVVDLVRWKLRAKKKLGAMNQTMKIKDPMERKMEEEKQRKVAMEKLGGLEESIRAMELSCEKVLRGLVNARVSLLNLLTAST